MIGVLDSNGNLIAFASVTDNVPGNGDEGTDTLESIEVLQFADGTLTLANASFPVELYDENDVYVASFMTIQDAIDAASDGYRIAADAGSYAEDLIVDVDVTIEGANAGLAGTDGARGAETSIDGSIDVLASGSGATVDGVRIVGTSNLGGFDVAVNVNATANGFSLVNSVLSGVESVTPPAPTFAILTGGVTGLDVSDNLIEGYAIGAYVSGGDTSGTFNDNLFRGDGAGSGTGLQQGVFLETSHVVLDGNTFDGIDGGAIFVNPHGPDSVDLRTIILNTIITDSGVDRPVQVLASAETPNMIGTDFNEAFYDPNFGGPNEILASLSFDGQGGNDHIFGNSFADDFHGGAGSDRVFGGAGDDLLSGGTGSDLLDGEGGIDSASFAGAIGFSDTVIGWITTSADGNDVLQNVEIAVDGDGQRNLLVGSTGFATLQAALNAAEADDDVRLAAGTYAGTFNYSDAGLRVIAQPGAVINATFTPSGSDGITVLAAGSVDHVTTGAGSDLIDGGAGADTMTGGAGDDQYFVDQAGDIVNEAVGGGYDIVYAGASYALAAGQSVDVLGTVNELATTAINLTGNELDNYVTGNAGANTIDGGLGGVDQLWGRQGDDSYFVDSDDTVVEYAGHGYDIVYARADHTLSAGFEIEVLGTVDNNASTAINLKGNELANYVTGNAGANTIDGGAGSDYLQGRGGADSFAFTTTLGATNVDEIADFVSGTDKIALDDAIFAGIGTPGSFDANAFFAGAAAHDADDRIIYNQATGQLFYDADGNGAGAAVLFGLVAGLPSLAASDFTVI